MPAQFTRPDGPPALSGRGHAPSGQASEPEPPDVAPATSPSEAFDPCEASLQQWLDEFRKLFGEPEELFPLPAPPRPPRPSLQQGVTIQSALHARGLEMAAGGACPGGFEFRSRGNSTTRRTSTRAHCAVAKP